MRPADQLLVAALEAMRADQLDNMLAIGARNGQPLAALTLDALRSYLEQLPPQERAAALELLGIPGLFGESLDFT